MSWNSLGIHVGLDQRLWIKLQEPIKNRSYFTNRLPRFLATWWRKNNSPRESNHFFGVAFNFSGKSCFSDPFLCNQSISFSFYGPYGQRILSDGTCCPRPRGMKQICFDIGQIKPSTQFLKCFLHFFKAGPHIPFFLSGIWLQVFTKKLILVG